MKNDQRLIPFLGGLVLGGVGTSIVDNSKMPYYNTYPGYYPYQYPAYNYYQPNQYQQLPINSTAYPMYSQYNYVYPSAKIVKEQPTDIIFTNQNRSYNDISYVPPYMGYK